MAIKTTRAFRTISEAGEELDLQPHVLRFWESKFSQIKPIKRGGGRHRPEDIEFIRGIKILLHGENHAIKDVQKMIKAKGAQSVIDLGQSQEKASRERDLSDTTLIPERIRKATPAKPTPSKPVSVRPAPAPEPEPVVSGMSDETTNELEGALDRLQALRSRWDKFKT